MPTNSLRPSRNLEISSTRLVLREAKRLHRAATSDSPSMALPVLRRLLAAAAVPATTLPNLFRVRHTVQRKHVLRALAFEAGHKSWEDYRQVLPQIDVQQLQQTYLSEHSTSTLKLWFSTEAQALQYAAEHGGQAVRVRGQAVVLPARQLEGAE